MKRTVLELRAPDVLEVDHHLLSSQGVEGPERLVHQQDGRIVDQCPADGDSLPHAARQLVWMFGFESVESDLVEEVECFLTVLVRLELPKLDLEEDVVEVGAPIQQHVALEDDPNLRHRPSDRSLINGDCAAGYIAKTGNEHQECALPATGWAKHRDELPRLDVEADVVESHDRTFRRRVHLGHARNRDRPT